MNNRGFIVKTASATVAFDFAEGKGAHHGPALTVQLPQALLERIDILLVSHDHGDHQDSTKRIPANIQGRAGGVSSLTATITSLAVRGGSLWFVSRRSIGPDVGPVPVARST